MKTNPIHVEGKIKYKLIWLSLFINNGNTIKTIILNCIGKIEFTFDLITNKGENKRKG